jgi:hypothetical protein
LRRRLAWTRGPVGGVAPVEREPFSPALYLAGAAFVAAALAVGP